MINRRQFLLGSAGTLLLRTPRRLLAAASTGEVFTLGVASGCPRSDRVVLWTRLAPAPLEGGGLQGTGDIQLRLRLCRDEAMRDSVLDTQVMAPAADGHSVHYQAQGLQPGREYWYQFYLGEEASAIGRTRTAPAADSDEPLRLALASCQHYETGLFAAYRDMAEQRPDLVVHVGDYIYEYADGGDSRLRRHRGGEIRTLWDYRNRYAQYRLDPQLQAAHAAAPWLVSLDDHEIDNNWAGYTPEDPQRQTQLEFRVRRMAALQAYYEFMPLERRPQIDATASSLRLYDAFDFGRQARLMLLDTRQYRSDQVCSQAFPSAPHCQERLDPDLTMTGAEQERFLLRMLDSSGARWNLLAQQTWMSPFRYPGDEYNMDQWDGYAAQRQRLLNRLADPELGNPLVLSGDWHCGCAMDVPSDAQRLDSAPVAAELATTSISSNCSWAAAVARALPENPQTRYWSDNRRGYLLAELDRDRCRAQFRLLDNPASAASTVYTDAELAVEAGRRGFAA